MDVDRPRADFLLLQAVTQDMTTSPRGWTWTLRNGWRLCHPSGAERSCRLGFCRPIFVSLLVGQGCAALVFQVPQLRLPCVKSHCNHVSPGAHQTAQPQPDTRLQSIPECSGFPFSARGPHDAGGMGAAAGAEYRQRRICKLCQHDLTVSCKCCPIPACSA